MFYYIYKLMTENYKNIYIKIHPVAFGPKDTSPHSWETLLKRQFLALQGTDLSEHCNSI